eukprot:gb/GFBE01064088.1/.p1 GENE.gb/GFBE01064088.1/~~gb/GFBE01064088.1/.p1  ORF type:complete len:338 (+),score=30.55 gb/GFBE01064088.1/:1-1014(+)
MPLTTLGLANPPQGLTMLHHPADDGKPIPFASHGDAMALDCVRPKDVPRGKIMCQKEDQSALRTHDIDGAAPTFTRRTLHIDGAAPKEHIPGSVAKTFWPDLNRTQDLSLSNFDIEKAQPCATGFRTTRNTNPLTPRYNLQSTLKKPPTPPDGRMHEGKLRETHDFQGERNLRNFERTYVRNPLDSRDIEGSMPNAPNRLRQTTPRDPRSTLETSGQRVLCSRNYTPRDTHPLAPDYHVDTKTTHPFYRSEGDCLMAPARTGIVPGSTPRVLHRDNGEPSASLIRSDLPGAVPQRYKGHMPFNIYDPPEVTPFSQHNGLHCKDIEGSQTGTRKSGTQ